MKKTILSMGVVLGTVLFVAPAFAESLKSALENTLFAASPSESIFLTVPNPAAGQSGFPDSLVLLSADSNPKFFGKPIQTGGKGALGVSFSSPVTQGILSSIVGNSVVPLPSGSAGFEYIFNPSLNVFERSSIGLGPIYNERVNTLGKGVFAFGVSYVHQDFDTFNGQSISNLNIASIIPKGSNTFVDAGIFQGQIKLDIKTDTAALYGIYGLTDRIDVSLLLPLTNISLRAQSSLKQGSPTLLSDFAAFLPDSHCDIAHAQAGKCRISDFTILRKGTRFTTFGEGNTAIVDTVDKSRFGVGDMVMRGKARLLDSYWGNFGGLAELTFPTGSEDNFLGDGAFKARFLILYSQSFFANRLNFHLNGGGKVTTQTSRKNTLEYGSAVDFMVTPRLSLVAEVLGSWRVDPQGLPRYFVDGAFGFKVNPFAGLILNASFRIPANDDGLRSDLVYLAGLEYDF